MPLRLAVSAALIALMGSTAAFAHDGHDHRHPAQLQPVAPAAAAATDEARTWLAGDHHVHSRYSVGYTPDPTNPDAPPTAIIAGDAVYPIPQNARMAHRFGLAWMVSTDHGGPNHSKLNAEQAYPELLMARQEIPDLLLFYGMEFDTPGGDHSSLILPRTEGERDTLRDLESRFAKREAWPTDPARDQEPRMVEALRVMDGLNDRPVVIANHPSRSATGLGEYGQYDPAELRDWNDTAPRVAVGMEGAPGHQAATLNPDGSIKPDGVRGIYGRAPTMGGFDQMTARLGGFWDSMLGEGRRWWITSTSDSHRHYSEGGVDFWPGEYSKTYVLARRDHADVLDGLREGRIFVTTGDLISELDVTAQSGGLSADIGGELKAPANQPVVVAIRLRDPAGPNVSGKESAVARLDLIVGDVTGPRPDRDADHNPSTRVERRFTAADWTRDGEIITVRHTLPASPTPRYIRVRGTNGAELEPTPDPAGEDPWSDLWFYANPVFITPQG